jgi:hypothetical protein
LTVYNEQLTKPGDGTPWVLLNTTHLPTKRMASAELFKVTCVTCRSSLSVRNPALIGQIVACPKCNSMVEIAPPAATAAAVAAAVAPIIEQPAVAPPTFDEPLETVAHSAAADVPPVAEVASVLEVGTASSVKFIIWSAVSFMIGATLVGTFLIMGSSDAPEQVPTAQVTTETPIASPVEQSETIAPQESYPTAEKSVPNEPATEQPSSIVIAEVEEPADDNPFAVAETQAEPPLTGAVELPTEVEAPAVLPVTPPQDEPEQRLVISDEPRVARKFDPLALDPEQMDLSTVSAAGANTTDEASNETDRDTATTAPPVAPPEKEPPANLGKVVKINKDLGRNISRLSAEIQMKRVLPAVAAKDMPLIDFLTMISHLAGVPVSIAPDQLQMAGITAHRTRISIDANDKSIAEVLVQVLDPLHLEARTDGPQIIVVRQDASKVRSVDYPIEDLLGGQITAAQFALWIQALVAPESWQVAGGDGKITVTDRSLQIKQLQAVQYEVLFFVERIRLAKQLPLKSRYPKQLLAAKPFAAMIADRIAAPAVFTFSAETPLAQVFQYWQVEMGLPVFVDWPALADVQLWPNSQITCAVANEPWHAALDKVLQPLDLGWRTAPGGGIEITARAKVETEPRLDIYPSNQWHGNTANATVIHDKVNNLTYVRAPASAHK